MLPINDQFSGVGAALKDSRLQGILKGAPNGATTLQYIMSDEKVVPGEEVITSGGDRIFPKGLPVGTVVSVEPGKDLFLNIRVIPSSRLDQLEEVLVVTKITEKMPDAKDLGPLRASDILAERLPTVPTKTEVDAAGNAKPGRGSSATAPAASCGEPHAGLAGPILLDELEPSQQAGSAARRQTKPDRWPSPQRADPAQGAANERGDPVAKPKAKPARHVRSGTPDAEATPREWSHAADKISRGE